MLSTYTNGTIDVRIITFCSEAWLSGHDVHLRLYILRKHTAVHTSKYEQYWAPREEKSILKKIGSTDNGWAINRDIKSCCELKGDFESIIIK